MITCQLQGGLGNQMFQVAAAIALAKKYNMEYMFHIDDCHTPLQGFTFSKYADNIFQKVNKTREIFHHSYKKANVYIEPEHTYKELPEPEVGALNILRGYFQSEKYFENININDYFTIPDTALELGEYATLHVRRGDYLKNPRIHPTCSKEYYSVAIERIEKELPYNAKILVFSDDVEWCKQELKSDRLEFRADNEIDTLSIMANARHNIICNSSFSWWGAYLNKNQDKIVISPSKYKWFGPDGPKDNDIIPKNFSVLEV